MSNFELFIIVVVGLIYVVVHFACVHYCLKGMSNQFKAKPQPPEPKALA